MCLEREVAPDRYERLSVAFGEPGVAFSSVVAKLNADIGLEGRLRDFGFTDADAERVIEVAMRSDNVRANPRPAEAADLRALLEQAR